MAPSHRFDIAIEADLIEEVARIHGYDSIPETTAISQAPLETVTESQIELERVAATLIARDYQEVVTYSFIDADANQRSRRRIGACSEQSDFIRNVGHARIAVAGAGCAAAANTARQQDRVRFLRSASPSTARLERTRRSYV